MTPIQHRMTAYMIGHSTRSAEELLALLTDPGVQLVADVRAFPSSRRHPQFNRGALAAWLGTAAGELPTAIMCAEAVWWRCHRRLIADALVARPLSSRVRLLPGVSHRLWAP